MFFLVFGLTFFNSIEKVPTTGGCYGGQEEKALVAEVRKILVSKSAQGMGEWPPCSVLSPGHPEA